jgi:uncharacterized membrane protein
MVGMLQIITYLLCVYLIFKGFEILQIALMSSREDRAARLLIGVLFVVIAIAAAGMFVKMIDAQATSVSSRTSSP